MMMLANILETADRALADAQQGELPGRVDAITRFMRAFEDLARQIAIGSGTWENVRPWALGAVDRVQAVRSALADWEIEMGNLFYRPSGDEVDAEAALDRRSQHAFAREAFRGTPVDAMLAEFEDAEVDQDFHEEAARLALDAPSWVPRSHAWWRWRDS
jgi:hypothetical protein